VAHTEPRTTAVPLLIEKDQMDLDPESAKKLIARIGDAFDELPAELKKAARYVTSNPSEVAFRSMRSVATGAGVSPSTMVRLARALGLDGFDELRAAFQMQLQTPDQPFLARSRNLRASNTKSKWTDRVHGLIDEELASIHAFVQDLDDRDLEKVGTMLTAARRVYVIGLRGMYPAAFFFHYSATMFSDKTALIDGSGGTSLDVMRTISAKDVALVFTCRPYPREILRALRFVHQRSAKLIAVTDGPLSPAVRAASVVFNVRPTKSSLLSSAAANVLVSRVLAAVFLVVSGKSSVAAIRSTDQHFAAFEVYSES
jgi:DNA-binding MurR/RpiR family transcriptional regulator